MIENTNTRISIRFVISLSSNVLLENQNKSEQRIPVKPVTSFYIFQRKIHHKIQSKKYTMVVVPLLV